MLRKVNKENHMPSSWTEGKQMPPSPKFNFFLGCLEGKKSRIVLEPLKTQGKTALSRNSVIKTKEQVSFILFTD